MNIFVQVLNYFTIQEVFLATIIYFGGYALAPTVCYKNIRLLTGYPLWVQSRLEHFLKKNKSNWQLFAVLLLTNCLPLLLVLFSALIPVVPFVLAGWLGLKLGIIAYKTLEGEMFFSSLINPVAIFELPAFFITLALAFNFNLQQLGVVSPYVVAQVTFGQHLAGFLLLAVPLLSFSSLLELLVVRLNQKAEQDQ